MISEPIRYPGINLGKGHPDVDEEGEALIFGFWIFLMSDAIIFGLLFATYASMLHSTAGGPGPKQLFDMKSAYIETMVLLASSFTFGMASLSLKHRRDSWPLVYWLSVTMLLGIVFLGFEVHDFLSMMHKDGGPTRSGFASAFFALVPLHGLHVTGGIVWMLAMMGQLAVHGRDKYVKVGLLRLGLFWHFLDIIWIAIFSIVYLGGLT